jgi:hypothetical protein
LCHSLVLFVFYSAARLQNKFSALNHFLADGFGVPPRQDATTLSPPS